MPQSYSYDLRTKVMKALDGGMKKTEASKTFNISRNTINLWLKRRNESGDYRAKKGYQQGYNPKIQDLEEFKNLFKKIVVKPKKKWRKRGEKKSVIKPSVKP
jgi:transposase